MSAFRPTSSTPTLGRFAGAFAMSVFIAPLVATSALASCDDTTTADDDDDTAIDEDEYEAERRAAYESVMKLPECEPAVEAPTLLIYDNNPYDYIDDFEGLGGVRGAFQPAILRRDGDHISVTSGSLEIGFTVPSLKSDTLSDEMEVALFMYSETADDGGDETPRLYIYNTMGTKLLLWSGSSGFSLFGTVAASNEPAALRTTLTPTCRLTEPPTGAQALDWRGVWVQHDVALSTGIYDDAGFVSQETCTVTDAPIGSCTSESYTITTSGFELFYNEPGWVSDCTCDVWLAGKREVLVVAK